MRNASKSVSRATISIFAALLALLPVQSTWAQRQPSVIPQGSSLPGLGTAETGLNGPGYIELGGSRSSLSGGLTDWTDAYLRAFLSGGSNGFSGEFSRQQRWGELGYWYSLGWTRTITENWYSELTAGTSSTGGRFLPKYRFDGMIHRKLLPRKQLVVSAGGGYDKSKDVNTARRFHVGGAYYFEWPFVIQAGVTRTYAQPGSAQATSEFLALTQGHEKEHYITVRAELGREAYELLGGPQTLFNFPIHNYSASYRQWIGVNWGVNLSFEHDGNPYYKRNGGVVGIFFDF